MHTIYTFPQNLLRQKWPIIGRVSSWTLGRVSQPKDACLGPLKDKWASWVLESILFLVFASIYQEEAKVFAGEQGACLGRSRCLCCLALGVPMN